MVALLQRRSISIPGFKQEPYQTQRGSKPLGFRAFRKIARAVADPGWWISTTGRWNFTSRWWLRTGAPHHSFNNFNVLKDWHGCCDGVIVARKALQDAAAGQANTG